MLNKTKEKIQQKSEEKAQQIREEKNRLLSMSEKELLVEIIMELKCIEDEIDDVKRAVRIYGN